MRFEAEPSPSLRVSAPRRGGLEGAAAPRSCGLNMSGRGRGGTVGGAGVVRSGGVARPPRLPYVMYIHDI